MKKILHTIYKGLLAIAATALTCTSCVDDDLMGNKAEVVEGEPITISLNFAAIPSADVSITRASGSDLSELSDVVICVFHGDGTFEQMVTNYNSTSLTVGEGTTTTTGESRYNVSFKSTSGEKKLIALANVADGAYWDNLITELTTAHDDQKNFDQVKAIVANLSQTLVDKAGTTDGMQPFHITSSSQMLITGWNEGVVFGTGDSGVTDYGTYGDSGNTVAIKMQRAMAHITFNITASPEKAKGTFTPSSFRVYNIPTKSYLTNDLQGPDSYALTTGVTDEYIYTAAENIGTAQGGYYSFNFYMPENVQEAGSSTTYNQREVWTGESGASPEEKTWTNAPQNSTFVVINGTYEGEATVDGLTQSVTANVEYTIHLGDFGESTEANRNYGDFSVMRNYSYTYTVNVMGVDKIIVEAQKTGGEGDYQNGAEGSVYDQSSTEYSYNLDAHYEQVYLEYNLTSIANSLGPGLSGEELDNAIADQLILIIQSEAMDYTHEETTDEPYTTRNKRGTLSPYKIYADAVRTEDDAAKAKADVLDGAGSGINPEKGFDYKWIEFLPQEGTDISAYPGISSWAMENLTGLKNGQFYAGARGTSNGNGDPTKLIDVYDMIVEMGKAIKQIYENGKPSSDKIIIISPNGSNYVARFTAFVNEYYYLRHPLTGMIATSWSVMTNKIPREMIIAMSTEISTDGNSSYSKIHSYISQLSMETFYNDRVSTINAFGIETYNETPLSTITQDFSFYGNNSTSTHLDDYLTSDDGRSNQKYLINAYNATPNWSTYINNSNNGWKSSVGTNRASHKLSADAYSIRAAYSACMSRNRDLNGNGVIDENEIRWFLPSLNEYIRIGIGVNALTSAARLYMGSKSEMTRDNYMSGDNALNGAYYFTSSPSAQRVFWAVEKGSYSADGIYVNYNGPKPIRCIRVLPAAGEGVSTDISSISGVKSDATYKIHRNTTPMTLEFKDRLVSSLYRVRTTGSLNVHNEDGDANSFYDGIYVAANYLPNQYAFSGIIGYNQENLTNPCSTYREADSEGNFITNWRVPNLVELSAMNAAGLLTENTSSCTQFSNLNVRYGFVFTTGIGCLGSSVSDINNYINVRCVRDVPANYTFLDD